MPRLSPRSVNGRTCSRPVHGWQWIAATLLAYTIGFSTFQLNVFTSSDEVQYVEQAAAFARGGIALPRDVRLDSPIRPMSGYPPGTSLLQTPFVLIGGWRAAAWASLLCMAATVVMLARWLRQAGYAPEFALLFLAYAPTLVMGRLALSDVPSAAIVTWGLWLFWTGANSRWKWPLAGFLAGVSLLFRETNALLFIPFFAAAVLRREPHWRMLVAGGVAGVGARLLAFQFVFGSPFFVGNLGGRWTLVAAVDSAPVYALALLLLVPGGLLAAAAYRGPRRAELIATVILHVGVYTFYDYSGQSSEGVVRLAVAGRFFIPLVPLLALATADSVPRWCHAVRLRRAVAIACPAILVAAFAVHPVVYAWSVREAAIVRDIYAITPVDGALIAGYYSDKYVSPLYGRQARIAMTATPASDLAAVTSTYPSTYIVLVYRFDTAAMAVRSSDTEDYVERARRACQLHSVHDRSYGPARRLRIWQVRSCTA